VVEISLIVPTLNEAGNVSLLLEGLIATIPDFKNRYEVIFADSGSIDGTCFEIATWQKKLPVNLFSTKKNMGLAHAVLAASKTAKAEILVVMDCDLSHPVDKVDELVHTMIEKNVKMVIGSRYVPGGSTPDWPLQRRLISKIATIPARCFTPVHDPMAGFFAVRKEVLQDGSKIKGGFKLAFEILTQNGSHFPVTEIPIQFRDREIGSSKMGKRVIFEYIRQLLRLTVSAVRKRFN
jgi:dolichol-phosphate mannosyltransferase